MGGGSKVEVVLCREEAEVECACFGATGSEARLSCVWDAPG